MCIRDRLYAYYICENCNIDFDKLKLIKGKPKFQKPCIPTINQQYKPTKLFVEDNYYNYDNSYTCNKKINIFEIDAVPCLSLIHI